MACQDETLLVARTPEKPSAAEEIQRCAVALAARTTSGRRRNSGLKRLQDLLQEYEEARHILIRRVEPRRAASAIQYRSTRPVLFKTG